eukprot:scaffold113704_cov22-Tisochrysis_lutea.AAC.2
MCFLWHQGLAQRVPAHCLRRASPALWWVQGLKWQPEKGKQQPALWWGQDNQQPWLAQDKKQS